MLNLELEDLGIGGIKVYQSKDLYRFTSDSILLAKFASFKKNDVVADFCAGSGIVGFYYFGLNAKTKSMTFFEMQKALFDLSNKSIKLNNLTNFSAVNIKVQDIGKEYNNYFSLILCNPPYKKALLGECSDKSIAVCKSEIALSYEELICSSAKRLKFGGRLAMCCRADRLDEIIYLMCKNKVQPKRMQLVQSTRKSKPYLALIEGVRGGKSGIKIDAAQVLKED